MQKEHTISTIKVNLRTNSQQEVNSLQDRFIREFQTAISERLEAVLDRYVQPEEVIEIDRLHLDLGHFDKDYSPGELSDRLEKAMQESLENITAYLKEKAQYRPEKDLVDIGVTKREWKEVTLELLTEFLVTGRGSHLSSAMDPTQVVTEILNTGKKELLPDLIRKCWERGGEQVVQRLVYQFPLPVSTRILALFYRERTAFSISKTISLFSEERNSTLVLVRELILQVLYQQVLKQIDVKPDRITNFLDLFYQKINALPRATQLNYLEVMVDQVNKMELYQLPGKNKQQAIIQQWHLIKKESAPDQPGGSQQKQQQDRQEYDLIYCENAGIILLHPFIKTLFSNLGYLKENKQDFLSDEKRERGLFLLHYLATGKESIPEEHSFLYKLLCGIPLNVPVHRYSQLTKTEKKEANEVLTSAIGYWSALKKTSPDGLREAFLQREGRLKKKQHKYLLKVESTTMDILLKKLPWGISIVKLPWMKDLLQVEWH